MSLPRTRSMKFPESSRIAIGLVLVCVLFSGCRTETQDPEVLAFREQYVLTSEPADAITLSELAQRLDNDPQPSEPLAEDAIPEADRSPAEDRTSAPVVVVGRIFAGDLEPWDSGKASFLLAELPEEGHGEGHDADNCPFCKRRAAMAPTAIVQFLDENGEVIPRDARNLFGLEKKDVVTIRGQATRGDLNTLIVTANAIHVRGK